MMVVTHTGDVLREQGPNYPFIQYSSQLQRTFGYFVVLGTHDLDLWPI